MTDNGLATQRRDMHGSLPDQLDHVDDSGQQQGEPGAASSKKGFKKLFGAGGGSAGGKPKKEKKEKEKEKEKSVNEEVKSATMPRPRGVVASKLVTMNPENPASFSMGAIAMDLPAPPLPPPQNGAAVRPVAIAPSGLCGLQNHGNTCYINSVVQCLAHIDALAHYFAYNIFEKDLSSATKKENGRKELTESFAGVVRSLWKCQYKPAISQSFKVVLSTYRAEYKSKDQQDAQEFLLFLLDTLHEELNISKKVKALKQRQITPANETAMIIEDHARRNRSLLYQLFTGYQQSNIVCPVCQYTATNTDPFTCLSLPIPIRSNRTLSIVHADLSGRLTRYAFSVNITDTVALVVEQLTEVLSVEENRVVQPQNMLLCELGPAGFGRTFKANNSISTLFDAQPVLPIFAVELRDPVMITNEDSNDSDSADSDSSNEGPRQLVARPQRRKPVIATQPVKEADTNFVRLVFFHAELEQSQTRNAGGATATSFRRFTGPWVLEVQLQMTFSELENHILSELEAEVDCAIPRDPNRRLAFHVVDGKHQGVGRLTSDVDIPLINPLVDRAFNFNMSEGGIRHLKLVVEWPAGLRAETVGDLPDDIVDHSSVSIFGNKVNQNDRALHLSDCLDAYLCPEQLEQEEAWNCPKCRKRQQITVRMNLFNIPDILVLHLKRFKQVIPGGIAAATGAYRGAVQASRNNKLTLPVEFPLEGLDMRPYLDPRNVANINPYSLSTLDRNQVCDEDFLYDLIGVTNHFGTLQSGHYTAFSRNPSDGRLYSFNDDKVEEMNPSAAISSAAYLLFYQRRSLRFFNPSVQYNHHWSYELLGLQPPRPTQPKSDPLSRRIVPPEQAVRHPSVGKMGAASPTLLKEYVSLSAAPPPQMQQPIYPANQYQQMQQPLPPLVIGGEQGVNQRPHYAQPLAPQQAFVFPAQGPPQQAPRKVIMDDRGTTIRTATSNVHVPNWREKQQASNANNGTWVWRGGQRVWTGSGPPPSSDTPSS